MWDWAYSTTDWARDCDEGVDEGVRVELGQEPGIPIRDVHVDNSPSPKLVRTRGAGRMREPAGFGRPPGAGLRRGGQVAPLQRQPMPETGSYADLACRSDDPCSPSLLRLMQIVVQYRRSANTGQMRRDPLGATREGARHRDPAYPIGETTNADWAQGRASANRAFSKGMGPAVPRWRCLRGQPGRTNVLAHVIAMLVRARSNPSGQLPVGDGFGSM